VRQRAYLSAVVVALYFALGAGGAQAQSPPPGATAWLGTWSTNQGTFAFDGLSYVHEPYTGYYYWQLAGTWHGKRVVGGLAKSQGYEVFSGDVGAPIDPMARYREELQGVTFPYVRLARTGEKITDGFYKQCGLYGACTPVHPIVGRNVAGVRAPKKILIFGLGDSLSSGEGSPDTRRGSGSRASWQSPQCDRSNKSYQALVVKRLRAEHPNDKVMFDHLACSGAAIDAGLLEGFKGVNGGKELPAQADEARSLARHRTVDALMLSAGVNDLLFGKVISFCVNRSTDGYCPTRKFRDGMTLAQWVEHTLGELPHLYKRLAARLNTFVAHHRVFILQYPDLLSTSATGRCPSLFFYKPPFFSAYQIRGREVDWLYDHFYLPLNREVAAAAGHYHWTLMRAPATFSEHGYCTADRWIVQYEESYAWQGNENGTLHPNETGQEKIANAVYPVLSGAIKP
jgi:lysophospholipase L1-like esterase